MSNFISFVLIADSMQGRSLGFIDGGAYTPGDASDVSANSTQAQNPCACFFLAQWDNLMGGSVGPELEWMTE